MRFCNTTCAEGTVNNSPLPCPACGENLTNHIGRLRINSGIIRLTDPGNIYECPICGLLFRRPYLSPLDLAKNYGELPAILWNYSEPRTDFNLAASVIRKMLPSGSILDVGCFRGDFLAMLPANYQKFGIEHSESARQVARQRGITLIGELIEEIESERLGFHAITLLDVIEHLPYPFVSLQRLLTLLLPGGTLILSTGNTDVLPWRLMRRDYYYYFSEHVSFFNPRWFRWVANQLNLNLVLLKRFSHFGGSSFERWEQFAKCLAFWTVEHVHKYPLLQNLMCSIYPFNKVSQWSLPPMTHLWRDHILVVLKSGS